MPSPDDASVVMAVTGPDGTRLLVAGDLDPAGEERFRWLLDDAVTVGAHVVVDLSRSGRLSHAALHALATTHRRLGDANGSLTIEAPSFLATRALRTSGLYRALDIRPAPAPSEPGALAEGA